MPRHPIAVKIKSYGAVDIHFHGAFGIDVMVARPAELDRLSQSLRKQGVAAFCPTTLSAPLPELRQAIRTLGQWIEHRKKKPLQDAATPIGIHLEGPYLHPGACGAHPPRAIRKFNLRELQSLWDDSRGQIKIVTLAPENVPAGELTRLCRWARTHRIKLSLGHSRASEQQASSAVRSGFSNVTHGWNAMGFHQRSPGVMGAVLGKKGVWIELILDQIHVSPTVMRWTRDLHGSSVCYVSDCTPAAATSRGSWHSMGPLRVRLAEGASRTQDGHLAGGGLLLPHAFARWIQNEARARKCPAARLLKSELPSLGAEPLKSLGLSPKSVAHTRLEWHVASTGRVKYRIL